MLRDMVKFKEHQIKRNNLHMCNMQPRTLLAAQKHLEQIYVGKRTHFLRVAIHKTHRLRETGGRGEEDTFGKMGAKGIYGH